METFTTCVISIDSKQTEISEDLNRRERWLTIIQGMARRASMRKISRRPSVFSSVQLRCWMAQKGSTWT
ncbi:TPA: hypothetical protein N0F65_007285 [Lagenidium giganteum]|uniref:Uncharacterized protein n=1 Tax=Lagenidium giganteum TaxID=4803 RepID=A0AAV2Z360_9STRA|nr:TPA: hypothetical protein N0F65_007285 [Lagenidium giganteum]